MDNKDFSDIGEQIRRTMESALGSQNFEQLNKTISDSVNGAIDEVRKSIANVTAPKKGEDTKDRASAYRTDSHKEYNKDSLDKGYPRHQAVDTEKLYGDNDIFEDIDKYIRIKGIHPEKEKSIKSAKRQKLPSGVRVNYPSRVSGILYTVFGSIGVGVTAILTIVFLFVSLLVKPIFDFAPAGAVFFLVLGCIFAGMLCVGKTRLDKIRRLKTYIEEVGNKTYCPVEQLSAAVGKPQRYVLKDVERLIAGGILPEGRLDEKKTCLMLDKATYLQYLEAQKNFAERKRMEAEDTARKEAKKQAEEKVDCISAEVRKMIDMGRDYVEKLKTANDAIPGEQISLKLSRLENVISRIFETVEKHPEQAGGMERFMEYYLPTTIKLVNTYRDFDGVDTEGGNVASAKHEIENTLDTIIKAFERLLDDLYADAALDASTDASVLQTMLKQDGFTDSDFN